MLTTATVAGFPGIGTQNWGDDSDASFPPQTPFIWNYSATVCLGTERCGSEGKERFVVTTALRNTLAGYRYSAELWCIRWQQQTERMRFNTRWWEWQSLWTEKNLRCQNFDFSCFQTLRRVDLLALSWLTLDGMNWATLWVVFMNAAVCEDKMKSVLFIHHITWSGLYSYTTAAQAF